MENSTIGILMTVILGLLAHQYGTVAGNKAKIRLGKGSSKNQAVMEMVGNNQVSSRLKTLVDANAAPLCYEGSYREVCDVLDTAVEQENKRLGLRGLESLRLDSCELADGDQQPEENILVKVGNQLESVSFPDLIPCK